MNCLVIATIVEKTALHRFKNSGCREKIITDLAREDIADKKFAHSAATAILRNLVPDYNPPADLRFEIFDTGQGYAVDTNIDFVELNKKYHRYVSPSYCTIDTGSLLTHIIDARLESYFGACYMAEIVTTPVLSDLIRLKHFDFLQRRENNVQEIKLFQELSLPDTPTIREAINSGSRTVSEFLTLIDNAERFRSWIRTANPDTGLIRSYYLAATRQTWADKLPTKTIRFVMATGADMLADLFLPTGIGTAAGVTVGAADSLYLDRY
jgi:hypothetical protein